MVIRKPVTRVMVALWYCLLTEYPEPHLTMDYGIPSNTTCMVLLKRICKLIEWKVGRAMTAPTGFKQPKMREPSKYSGNRNHDVFLQWLNQFLNWLRSHYYCREDTDFSRINSLGSYPDGVAADWFAADVDNPNEVMDAPITFVDAICINGSSGWRQLTMLPTNMTRWNIALRLESKDSIMPWTKWLVAWLNDLATTHSAFECLKDCLPG
jgi:hypothetical protein